MIRLCLVALAQTLASSVTTPTPVHAGAVEVALRQSPEQVRTEGKKTGDSYRVGPGDVLEVSVYDNADLSRLVTVQHDGRISFPLLGDLVVAGSSVTDVKARLQELLGRDFLVNPQVEVKVKEYRSQWVTVAGEVMRPGKYYLDGPKTLLELLTEVGGFTMNASGEVAVTRQNGAFEGGGTSLTVRLARDMAPAAQKQSLGVLLVSGDLVSVANQRSCYVTGEVKNPGSFALTAGLTVLKAVSLAGGLSKFGNKGKVEILRKVRMGDSQRIKIDLDEIERGKAPDVVLFPDDIVKVGKRVF